MHSLNLLTSMGQALNSMLASEYHAHPAISKSKLDSINRSPLHYWSRFIDTSQPQAPPSEAMLFGSAFHTALLEPDLFATTYQQAPQLPRNTKAGKEAWAAAAQPGITLLKCDDWERILGMQKSILAHPLGGRIMQTPKQVECSLFSTDPETGLQLKARPDILTDSGWVIDLKTTVDASQQGFERAIGTYRYHVQAAHYLKVIAAATGRDLQGFLFLAVEKTPPYAVQIFRCAPEVIDQGNIDAATDLATLAQALSTYPPEAPWPSYSDSLTIIGLPSWLPSRTKPQLPVI
jgi:hypothetical protein